MPTEILTQPMPTMYDEQLIQQGYMPAEIVLLRQTNTLIIPLDANLDQGKRNASLKLAGFFNPPLYLLKDGRLIDDNPIQSLWVKVEDNITHLAAFPVNSKRPLYISNIGESLVVWKFVRKEG